MKSPLLLAALTGVFLLILSIVASLAALPLPAWLGVEQLIAGFAAIMLVLMFVHDYAPRQPWRATPPPAPAAQSERAPARSALAFQRAFSILGESTSPATVDSH